MLVALALAGLFPACISPSRTITDYERKAANSAEAMISAAESALLTAELASSDKAPGRYVSLRMSESEDAAEWIISSFSAVQPPSADADKLRDDLLTVMEEASTIITRLRIQSYRGQSQELAGTAKPLGELSRELEEFEQLGQT